MYIVVSSFKDLTDNEFEYTVGDEFPRKERSINDITKDRLEELTTKKNKKGKILIKEINVERNSLLEETEDKGKPTPENKKVEPEAEGELTPEDEKVEPETEGEPTPEDEKVEPEAEGEPTPEDEKIEPEIEKNTKINNKSTKNKK